MYHWYLTYFVTSILIWNLISISARVYTTWTFSCGRHASRLPDQPCCPLCFTNLTLKPAMLANITNISRLLFSIVNWCNFGQQNFHYFPRRVYSIPIIIIIWLCMEQEFWIMTILIMNFWWDKILLNRLINKKGKKKQLFKVTVYPRYCKFVCVILMT